MKKAAKVFLILGAISGWWMVFPLVIAIKNINRINSNAPITTGKKVVVLIFCSLPAGIFMLCDRSESILPPPEPIVKYEPAEPVLEEPAPKKKTAFPVFPLILTLLALVLQFIRNLATPLVNIIIYNSHVSFSPTYILSVLINLSALTLFAIGLILHAKKGHILCGVALLLQALTCVFAMFTDNNAVYVIADILGFVFLVLSGVFYLTRVKVLGTPLKLIFGILAVIGIFAAGIRLCTWIPMMTGVKPEFFFNNSLERIFEYFTNYGHVFLSICSSCAVLFVKALHYIAVILFTPKKENT
ncbi:MAG: hypothetical protein E7460_04770 [Ruminococcaceae bacterium]|nr:hypothetical protein [Oscillospiraceae bacterium]